MEVIKNRLLRSAEDSLFHCLWRVNPLFLQSQRRPFWKRAGQGRFRAASWQPYIWLPLLFMAPQMWKQPPNSLSALQWILFNFRASLGNSSCFFEALRSRSLRNSVHGIHAAALFDSLIWMFNVCCLFVLSLEMAAWHSLSLPLWVTGLAGVWLMAVPTVLSV